MWLSNNLYDFFGFEIWFVFVWGRQVGYWFEFEFYYIYVESNMVFLLWIKIRFKEI